MIRKLTYGKLDQRDRLFDKKSVEYKNRAMDPREMKKPALIHRFTWSFVIIMVFFVLYLTSLRHYLLFHSLVEIFSIIIACGIFMIAWNSRRFMKNNYILFIGIAYIFVGSIDTLHTLAYKGMGVLQGNEANLSTQLWVSARYLESLSFLIAPLFINRKLRTDSVFFCFLITFSLLMGSIFYWHVFPECYAVNTGLTIFKKTSEYIISLILAVSGVLLFQRRNEFEKTIFRLLLASIIVTIGAEMAFTLYISVYGFFNFLGHFFKIVSFYLIYKAVIETGLVNPYSLLFRDLNKSKDDLQKKIYELGKRVKELSCLYGIAHAREKKGISLDEMFQEIVDLIPPSWQYPDITCSRITFYDKEYKTDNFKETSWKQTSYIVVHEERVGSVEVYYFEEKPESNEGPFLKEERELINAIAERMGKIIEYQQARESLQEAHDELEMRVSERTAQLIETNQELQSEIEERKKAEELLKKSEMELKHLSARLLEAHEEERKRIGQELHDGLAQTMSAIKVWGENALLQMRKGDSKDRLVKTMESVVRLAQGSVEEVRRILRNLRPSILDDLGILSTISWLCNEFETIYSGIGIKKDICIEENQVPDSLKIVIFRILQEALNNITKHSKASLARLSLKKSKEGKIELSIHDNGEGFDVVHALSVNQPGTGFGISGMRERSELSGGSFSIDSHKGKGTTIMVSWPYHDLQPS
jgi:signal transduction histidine kinase